MSADLKREYKSPDYKLVAFFEKSRDQWKAKAMAAKRHVNKLKERLRQVDGEMSIDSRPLQGTTIQIRVPRLSSESQQKSPSQSGKI